MYLLTLFLILLALGGRKLLSAIANYRRKCHFVKSIPGWPTHWFLGNLPQLLPTDQMVSRYIRYIASEKHKVTRLWLGPAEVIINLHHPDAVKQVLKTPKSKYFDALTPWLGDGLLTAKGHKWAKNRRLLTPAFHSTILKPYVSVYNDCIGTLIQKWSDSARAGLPILLFNTVSLLSLDIILKCAFTYKNKCQDVGNMHPYINAVCELCNLTYTRYLNPFYANNFIYSLSKPGRRTKYLCELVHTHAEHVIHERRKALKLDNTEESIKHKEVFAAVAKKGRYLDFLDVLLSTEDEEGKGLSDIDIQNEVDTFMFTGHDTVSSGTSWTLYCLAKYPEHQQKVREEMRRVLDGCEQLEYNHLSRLQYTQWCIKEAMRLYPPVAFMLRETNCEMEVCGHTIPKGTQIVLNTLLIHRHPDVWNNPDDYDPLRFHPSEVDERDPYAYIPFSAGSRNCIGQNFAMNEMKVVVGSVLQRFQISLEQEDPPLLVSHIVLKPKEDICLKLEPLHD